MPTSTSPIGTQDQGRTYLQVTAETVQKGADYDIVLADRGKLFRFSGAGPWTAQIMTVAIVSTQFMCFIRNDSALDLTIETQSGNINGGPTLTVEPGLTVAVFCDGTNTLSGGVNLNCVPLIGGTMTGPLILSGDPATALGAATKQYVDAIASGIAVQPSCYAATTANLNATYANGAAGVGATLTNAGAMAAFAVDGVNPPLNARILVKDQTNTFENGCFTLTTVGSGAVNWVLTRATDYDTAAEIQPGTLFIINNGTVNNLTSWIETEVVATVGTDPVLFTQFTTSPANFANINLSNLAAVAINSDMLPGVDGAIDLGNATHRYGVAWVQFLATGTTAADSTVLTAYDTGAMANAPFIAFVAGNPATCAFSGDITSVTQAASDNSTKLATTAYADTQVTTIAANKALSNLAAVAINTSLLPAGNSTIDLGDGTHRMRQIYSSGLSTGRTAADTLVISGRDVDGASDTPFITIQAGNTPTCVIASSVTATTQPLNDNSTKLATTAYVDSSLAATLVSSQILFASGLALVNNVNKDLTSIALTAGTWDIFANVLFTPTATATAAACWINTTSATVPDASLIALLSVPFVAAGHIGLVAPSRRLVLGGATTVYITGILNFASGTAKFSGGIYAKKVG